MNRILQHTERKAWIIYAWYVYIDASCISSEHTHKTHTRTKSRERHEPPVPIPPPHPPSCWWRQQQQQQQQGWHLAKPRRTTPHQARRKAHTIHNVTTATTTTRERSAWPQNYQNEQRVSTAPRSSPYACIIASHTKKFRTNRKLCLPATRSGQRPRKRTVHTEGAQHSPAHTTACSDLFFIPLATCSSRLSSRRGLMSRHHTRTHKQPPPSNCCHFPNPDHDYIKKYRYMIHTPYQHHKDQKRKHSFCRFRFSSKVDLPVEVEPPNVVGAVFAVVFSTSLEISTGANIIGQQSIFFCTTIYK